MLFAQFLRIKKPLYFGGLIFILYCVNNLE
uniref:Uncharacterized protein n=1 Tax=Siphoviridae sp. cti6f5 TaxID=2826430 RepID=A0A8S5MD38_9CAUD|nr:MAG TPA: hypothetical protein [Siphoviridae sp. cti6f5]